jgi:short-subunit dehydrogenase
MATVLITGASGGIGYELAHRFARDGDDLILVARRADELAALAGALSGTHGVSATALAADLARPDAAPALADEVRRRGLHVDVLVNNAGVGVFGDFAESDLDAQLAMIQLDVTSLVHLTGLFLPGMVARGRGAVANLASTAAFQPGPRMAVYYASKAFVLSFSEALDHELRGSGITVTAVCPGPTPTGFQAAAGLQGSRLLRAGLMMDVGAVADAAYRGIRRGKRLVIPGIANRLGVQAVRFFPRRLITAVVGFANAKAS